MPTRLDMPIFKSTDLGAEVTYTLWHFDVDAFLEQYDEASMCPHISPGHLCVGPADAHGEDIQQQALL